MRRVPLQRADDLRRDRQPEEGEAYPQIFAGQYITLTRKEDGSIHPNFRAVHIGEGFNLEQYISGVANELLWGIEGLGTVK